MTRHYTKDPNFLNGSSTPLCLSLIGWMRVTQMPRQNELWVARVEQFSKAAFICDGEWTPSSLKLMATKFWHGSGIRDRCQHRLKSWFMINDPWSMLKAGSCNWHVICFLHPCRTKNKTKAERLRCDSNHNVLDQTVVETSKLLYIYFFNMLARQW